MRHSFRKITFVLFILIFIGAAAFANANAEKASETVSEKTEDKIEAASEVKSSEALKAIEAYEKEIEEFSKKYEELRAQLELAYDKNDATTYSKAKQELKNLRYPRLTEEKTNEIASKLAEDDFETADWLYQNSRYYNPVLRLESTADNFSYSSSMTANPGSDITLPEISGPTRAMIFEGWGLTESKVTYKAGESIKMPVKDLTLYAVFKADASIKEGKSLEIKDMEGLTVKKGKQCDFEFTVRNNGSETLKNLNIAFESDDPLFVILTDSLKCRYLTSGDDGVARFKVITKAETGTQLKGVITITDSDNGIWTDEVVFTVE